jgi:hypothetical protein
MGRTQTDYLDELRVDAARRLLIETDLPVGEVATRAGFANLSWSTAASCAGPTCSRPASGPSSALTGRPPTGAADARPALCLPVRSFGGQCCRNSPCFAWD